MDQPKVLPNYGAISHSVPATPLPVYYLTPLPPPPRKRYGFFKPFVAALVLIWFTHHLFYKHRHHSRRHSPYESGWDIGVSGLDHDAEGCAVWDHYDPDHPLQVTKDAQSSGNATRRHGDDNDKFTFSIPISSERYHFVSWGPIDKSSIQLLPVKSDKKQIVVEIEILKDPRGVTRVCALPSNKDDDNDDTYGVGIYSPRLPHPHPSTDWPAFKITVYVPAGGGKSLGALETRLGQFEHVFPDLSNIRFAKLKLAAANVPMSFDSVVADSVRVDNANGPISGNLVSASSLVISNANAVVRASLTLTQAGEIHLNNANGDIDVVVHLKSDNQDSRPDFKIDANNANAPIDLVVADQPVDSGLFIKSNNAMGAIRAHLHPAFEGEFKLSNILRSSRVEFNNHHDPSGRDRERYLDFYKRGSITTGNIRWGDRDAEHAPGSVTLSTVGAPLELYF